MNADTIEMTEFSKTLAQVDVLLMRLAPLLHYQMPDVFIEETLAWVDTQEGA